VLTTRDAKGGEEGARPRAEPPTGTVVEA
jgi:hypothetical protein